MELKSQVEAILFAAGRTVTLTELCGLTGISEQGLITHAIQQLKEEYTARDAPIILVDEQQGWKLHVQEKYLDLVSRINPHTELSRAVMETLAVVAWKQPILQSKIIDMRGVNAYEHVSELETRGFIMRQKSGRSFLLKPTQKFYDYFDLKGAEGAKALFKDFADLEVTVEQKQKQLEETLNHPNKEIFPHEDIKDEIVETFGELEVYGDPNINKPVDFKDVTGKGSIKDMTIASKKNVSAKNDTRPIEQPILAPKSLPTHEETAALAAKLLRNLDTALDGITAAERKIPGQGQAIAKSPEKGKDTSKKNEDKNLSSVDEDDIVMDNSEPEGVITAEDAEIDDQGMIKQK